MTIRIANHTWTLLPQKAVWIQETKTLLVSDLHLGKIEHFRKAGIALPVAAAGKSLEVLALLCHTYRPSRVLFLGDLFHSDRNSSYEAMAQFCTMFSTISLVLIEGNHDVLLPAHYHSLGIKRIVSLTEGPFLFTHEPTDEKIEGQVNVCGHIHPGVRLKGRGKQSLTLPCFYLSDTHFILPAFGYFTGKAVVRIEPKASIFAIAGDEVLAIK